MHALRYDGPLRLSLEELPLPELQEGDLLVEIAACGICATDVKTYMRGHPKIKPGTVLGHEMTGVAVNAAGGHKPGDRLAIAPYAPCGHCRYCRAAKPLLCETLFNRGPKPGGFAEYVRVPAALIADLVVPVPDSLPLAIATLAEPIACCLNALEHAQVSAGDSVVVLGDGPMGLIQAEAAKAMGAGPVIVTGLTRHRLAHAARVADHAVDVSTQDLRETVRSLLPQGADVVIVSIAMPEAADDAFALVARGGVIDLFAGTPAGTVVSADAQLIHYEGVRLQGSFGFAPPHFRKAIAWLASGELDGRNLVTGEVGIEEVATALNNASRHQGIKTVMVRREPGSLEG
jgi:L-iditol 2-dehydrogenase